MTSQLLPNLIYAVLLVVVLLTPYATLSNHRAEHNDQSGQMLMVAIAGWAMILTVLRGGFLLFGLVLLLPLIGRGFRAVIGAASAVLLFSTVTWWWGAETRMSPLAIGAFIALGLVAALLPRLGDARITAEERPTKVLFLMLACLVTGLAAGLLTAPFGSAKPIYMAWHHWGAFISPAEAWLSGGLPYRDFPIQYGLGPTALLRATCGSDCWQAMYGIVITANALYFATLAGSVLVLTVGLSHGIRALALLALFCAIFLWAGFPPDLAGPAMTPSVAGLRFLPIALLLLHILWAENRQQRRDAIGHVIWLATLFWSPEAAFFGTAIWWPYLALRNAGQVANRREAFIALLHGGLRAAGALALGLVPLALTVALLSKGGARMEDFFAYILHPPGPLPVEPFGAIWLLMTVIVIAIMVLADTASRALYACLLGLLAGGGYYLSRSHDNNLLNLFPLLVPVLLAIFSLERERAFIRGFVQTTLAAIVAFISTANFYPWTDAAGAGDLFATGPARLIDHFKARTGDHPQILPDGPMEALQYALLRGGSAIVLIDVSKLMLRGKGGGGWTGVNNLANYEPLPSSLAAHYVHQGAMAYCRPGWLVVDETRYSSWTPLFQADYRVAEERRFASGYAAYFLVPRQACTGR